MKLYLTRTACLLLSLVLTACAHKNQATTQPPLAPPVDDPPLSKPDIAQKDQLPPPVVTPARPVQPATDSQTDQPKPPPRRKKPASTTPAQGSSTTPGAPPASQATSGTSPATQQAANGTPGETSAIGSLSSGEPADLRSETVSTLNGTEHSLSTLNRKLSDQEEKTSAQIREYIKQARTALASNDLDGAHNLATKAKLLLDELTAQ